MNTTYLPNLTPLRGIAAVLTIVFHMDLMLGMGGDCLLKYEDSMLISRLYLMVDFFFVLSGFVMLHVYGKLFADGVTKANFKQFTIARFARVYPLHFVTLAFTVLLFTVAGAMGLPKNIILEVENSGYSIVTNLLLLHSMNLHDWFTWDHASWSISTEWWMYMLFPFLVVPFKRLGGKGQVVVAALCFVGYLAIMWWVTPIVTIPDALSFIKDEPTFDSVNVAYQYGFLRCLFGFVLGMVMYKCFMANWGKGWLASGYTLALLALGLFTCLHLAVPDAYSVMFFPFILLSAAYGSRGVDRLFGAKPLQRLGDWSFSIYLIHEPLMYLIDKIMAYLNPVEPGAAPAGPPPKPDMLTGWLICIGFIGLTLVIAWLTYRWVEVPARRWLKRG